MTDHAQAGRDAVEGATALWQAILDDSDQIAMLDRLLILREAKRYIATLVSEAERFVAGVYEDLKEADVGPHHVEVRFSKQRRWTDNDSLRSAVFRIARFDPETGEARTADDAVRIISQAFRCGGAEARTTWLRDAGIDVDEYSEGDWRTTVNITPNGRETEQ